MSNGCTGGEGAGIDGRGGVLSVSWGSGDGNLNGGGTNLLKTGFIKLMSLLFCGCGFCSSFSSSFLTGCVGGTNTNGGGLKVLVTGDRGDICG